LHGEKGTGDNVDIKLYDANFETTGKVIDTFSSLSYTDRWNADGDFKLVLPVGEYNTVKDAKYLAVNGRTFEISQINTADTSASDELTIAGHNLNVLLDRVVITTPARIQGNLEEQVRTLVSDYAITGWQSVDRLVLGTLQGYMRAIDANAPRGSLGDFLYTELNKRGFSFELNYDTASDEITFDIVQSKDRTEDQTVNAQAVFSAQKENLENMEYERNETEYYNCAVVCDEDPDNPQTAIVDLSNGEPKRTIYLAASSVYEDTENPPLYVMVGAGGYIATSTDGQTWTQQASGTTADLWAVDYHNGKFIAGGSSGKVYVSIDAITWTEKNTGSSLAIEGVGYYDGVYFAYTSAGGIRYSYDTTTWAPATRTGPSGKIVNSVWNGQKFIAYGADTLAYKTTSLNGIEWTSEDITVADDPTYTKLLRTCKIGNTIVSAGYWYDDTTHKPLTTSSFDNGETQTVNIIESLSGKRFLDMAAGLGVFLAVGQTNVIAWSTDGVTWTDCTPAGSSADYITVTFDGTLFHAYSATTKHHAYSADGKTWTLTTFTTTATTIDAVIYGAAQRQYSLYDIGYNALQNYKMVELINGDLLTTARPMIGTDCNVGDVVDIVDKERGIIVSKLLTEAQTVYERDANGIIYPNFGDGYLDLKKYIKKEVEKRG
jgi:hypothetical protein